MPRKLRIQYPGAMYHLMSRGDRGEHIFLDDVDRHDFIKTLAEACRKTDWQVHALAAPEHRPSWIRVDRLLGELGFQGDGPLSREGFEQRMEKRRVEEIDPEIFEPLRGGWCLGSESFRARRIIVEELERKGSREADLLARRTKDPLKLAIAARLRRETTLALKAIAARLCLGTSKSANGKLHEFMKGTGQKETATGSFRLTLCLNQTAYEK